MRGNFRGLIVDSPPGVMYPGADVRGYGRLRGFGAVASASSSPAELRARMQGIIDGIRREWQWAKAKILAGEFAAKLALGLDSSVAGLVTIDNVIALKEKSMGDVLGGQLTLEKWLNGVEVMRVEIAKYVAYVKDNASAQANLAKLGTEMKQTAADYGVLFVEQAKKVGMVLGGTTIALLIGAGFLLYKLAPTLLAMYLPPPKRTTAGYGRFRRFRA
jgi:hypothetical protein